ncbi:hypothetical protein EYF80_055694 [Liparis tanakae]|uniref:Uncharacterized protein n=1 Tax=Liparis tanakae TaxID=230148 RepID=A0A4Z2EZT7_9TELE|nr:hypothetical protein EYF80_055694 [Liparis tanakae]
MKMTDDEELARLVRWSPDAFFPLPVPLRFVRTDRRRCSGGLEDPRVAPEECWRPRVGFRAEEEEEEEEGWMEGGRLWFLPRSLAPPTGGSSLLVRPKVSEEEEARRAAVCGGVAVHAADNYLASGG